MGTDTNAVTTHAARVQPASSTQTSSGRSKNQNRATTPPVCTKIKGATTQVTAPV